MNKSDVAKVLTIASAVDNRRVEPETVNAWFELIGDLSVEVAVEAVRLHQRESDDYLMPVHVRRNAARVLRELDRGKNVQRWALEYEASEKARAVDPPRCEHDVLIAKCLPCSVNLAHHE